MNSEHDVNERDIIIFMHFIIRNRLYRWRDSTIRTNKSARSLIEVKFAKGEAVFLVLSQFPRPVLHDAILRASAECAISSWQRIKLLYKNVKGFASEPLLGV